MQPYPLNLWIHYRQDGMNEAVPGVPQPAGADPRSSMPSSLKSTVFAMATASRRSARLASCPLKDDQNWAMMRSWPAVRSRLAVRIGILIRLGLRIVMGRCLRP